jgi:hypothetical protein
MIGLYKVTIALASSISATLPGVIAAHNAAATDDYVIPMPRAIIVDSRHAFQTDQLPAIEVIPQITRVRTQSAENEGPIYKMVYQFRLIVTTDPQPTSAATARCRLELLSVLMESLLISPNLGAYVGYDPEEIGIDEGSIIETVGPIEKRTHWYGEGD